MTSTSPKFAHRRVIDQTLRTDLLVVGGGPAGVVAAIAAALAGREVVLVERYGFLGGNSTQVLDTFCGFFIKGNPPKKIVGGIPDRVIGALFKKKSALIRSSQYRKAGDVITYNPEVLKSVWESLALEAGVRLLYHALMYEVIMDGAKVAGVVVAVKGGRITIMARAVIDASGDADVAAAAGVPCERPQAGVPLQAMTTTLRITNVHTGTALKISREELAEKMAEAVGAGDLCFSAKGGSYTITTLPGALLINIVRVSNLDPTEPFDLTQAEVDGRQQGLEVLAFLKGGLSGFEHAALAGFSAQIGIRESRRVIGAYCLTRKDVLGLRRFDDEIALGGWPLEMHTGDEATPVVYLGGSQIYGIPYRCLLPQKVEGLLVAGRSLSADRDAHASVRVMAQCMAMGQAAGLAIHLALEHNLMPREIDVGVLQSKLVSAGALLHAP